MPNGNPSRSDDAPRVATPRLAIPLLRDTRTVSGCTPFSNGDGDEFADQGFALLSLLAASFLNSEGMREGVHSNDGFHNNVLAERRHGIVAEALEGVATLFALGRHFDDVKLANRHNALLDEREGR